MPLVAVPVGAALSEPEAVLPAGLPGLSVVAEVVSLGAPAAVVEGLDPATVMLAWLIRDFEEEVMGFQWDKILGWALVPVVGVAEAFPA